MSNKQSASQIKWQGRSWRLRVHNFQQADGSFVERGVIEHPGSVVIVPKMGEEILMLRQYRLALDQWILELPAGTLQQGEDPLSCAQRELQEETGYKAESWQALGKVWPAPGMTNELMALYLATELSEAPLEPDADEQIEVQPYPLSELVEMAKDGHLQDAKSVVAILRLIATSNSWIR